ncbi:manganese efflux pump MntP [Neomoorella thermoacetica]|uniref:manganese efflux pump MntP n=1 Tax=Neomoorella thermoacetica TaxID=1525 RepID=UPI0008FB8E83|nr:manganese efflux pump MntP family protein [Moorella thermoacetica]OIQ54133.1 putative manganese efflux pump MntP [Moorella thermoacetica]OIQ62484.1 putative manganese efflux pump MntP [Moorella thermoacetica]
MEPLGLILVAVALGTDAFSLATGLALGGFRGRQAWLFAGTVGLFHIFMPLAGLYLGLLLGRLLGKVAAIIGALVLATMGTLMLWEAYNNRRQGGNMVGQVLRVIPGRGGVLGGVMAILFMAGSVSLDALSVGFGLGAISVNVPLTVLTMGFIAATMTALGLLAGRRLGSFFGNRAELAGGLILVAIGLKMLVGV